MIEDLLIEFDEMGFAPTTLCENPEKYAVEWKKRLVAEIDKFQKASCKEFAEKIKTIFYYEFDEIIPSIMSYKIDELLKEYEK